MSTTQILSENEIRDKLKNLPGWKYEDNKLSKEYEFADFPEAFGFIHNLVETFETHDHHPDIHIFYNKILFELQRFDVGGKVTDKDIIIAEAIEEEYRRRTR